jgi:hypothetical protein
LYLSSAQQDAIQSLYARDQEFKEEFNSTYARQSSAQQILRSRGLPEVPTLKGPLSGCECWMTASSNTWGSNTGRKKRIIFQWHVSCSCIQVCGLNIRCSICGYDTAARQNRDRRGSQNPLRWTRQTDYEFRGCLAHADVTWNLASNQVERVIGHFEHSVDCTAEPVIRQHVDNPALSFSRKGHDELGLEADIEYGSRNLVTTSSRRLTLSERSSSQTGGPLGRREAHYPGEFSRFP